MINETAGVNEECKNSQGNVGADLRVCPAVKIGSSHYQLSTEFGCSISTSTNHLIINGCSLTTNNSPLIMVLAVI